MQASVKLVPGLVLMALASVVYAMQPAAVDDSAKVAGPDVAKTPTPPAAPVPIPYPNAAPPPRTPLDTPAVLKTPLDRPLTRAAPLPAIKPDVPRPPVVRVELGKPFQAQSSPSVKFEGKPVRLAPTRIHNR